ADHGGGAVSHRLRTRRIRLHARRDDAGDGVGAGVRDGSHVASGAVFVHVLCIAGRAETGGCRVIRAWILSLGMAFLCAGAPSWGAPAPQAKLTLDAFLDRARERDVEFQRILNEQVPAKYWRALN